MNTNSQVLTMILSVLKRKSITDETARENYIEVLCSYIDDLNTLAPINIDYSNPVYEHKVYLDKLIILSDRWKSIGDDVIPTDKLDVFLVSLQDKIRDYLNKNLQSDFYKLRKMHHTNLAFTKDMEVAPTTRLADLREKAFSNIRPTYKNNMG
jgi:hypothetical protein